MKLRLSYETTFGYVQKLQIAHLIPWKTVNIVSYNKFSKPRPGRAGLVFRPYRHIRFSKYCRYGTVPIAKKKLGYATVPLV